jgi:lipid-A-disaccharide synthase
VSTLLVVTGEASGDRAAAAVTSRLTGHRIFGLGGSALASTGMELVADLRHLTALGIGEAAVRALAVVRAFAAVLQGVKKRRPTAALLVGYTEFNARLAPRLKRAGIGVVWYGAPQVWAWRPGRTKTLGRFVDRMAVVLPFEERLWRNAGVDATFVGHPALETPLLARADARRALGMTPYAAGVGILPGSRPHEVRRLLAPMLAACIRLRSDRGAIDARVLVAPSLDRSTRRHVRSLCEESRIASYDVDPTAGAMPLLSAFDVTFCASGTASLEAAIAHAVPIVAYRVGLTTELAARLFLRVPHIALPNVLLRRRAFVELVQRQVDPHALARAAADALDRPAAPIAACAEVSSILGDLRTPSARVAEMLLPWL